jgi:acetylornithine deacetylase/succinyl-diaminopimelate desuccinylase-like protein
MAQWEPYLKDHQSEFVEQLLAFCRIPSISALPDHAGDVERAAEWTAQRLWDAGIENVQVMRTGGHPVVYGDWLHAPGKTTVLLYGHFDVQPTDPEALWTTPPFKPTIRDGRVYARGVSDNKSGVLITILAVEALLKTAGALPVNVKFCFEGQEEIGSPQIPAFVDAHKSLLACDMVLNSDGGQYSETDPALLISLRGACGVQIDVTGPKADQHSGVVGGAIQNPLNALAEIIASMHTPDGKIAVQGFYDDVVEASPKERARIAAIPADDEAAKRQLGVDELFGEPGYTTTERTWIRPTLDVNGIWGGFQGEGTKTVIAREGHAKITCRLVPNQTPRKIVDLLEAHVNKHTPKGVKAVTQKLSIGALPYQVPTDHPGNVAAAAVLKELYGKDPYYGGMGGSVPITEVFLRYLGAHTVSFGFTLTDEQVHAPNEFFRLSSFERGQKAFCLLLERLGR